ncbi:MAG: hypothetical protein WC781_03085 [Candidatus Pacearchaeota archaeon]|jgi:hypothetical protein
MEKKSIFIISCLVIILVALTSALVILLNQDLNPSSSPSLTDCNVIKESGEGKINLVFFSSRENAKLYSDFLETIAPFDNIKDEFNVYSIENYTPKCELYQGIALLCYSKELVKKAGSCPNDYIIVLDSKDSTIRSSAYMNVMSINMNHLPTVLPHEFGHVFANLAEEYVPAEITAGSKNCQLNCDKFENNSCFIGCSKSDYYRSIESGIMRTLSSTEYGKFDEGLIMEKISSKFPSMVGRAISETVDCSLKNYYLIEGKYQLNQITILDKTLETGCIGSSGSGGFNYNVILDNNNSFNGEFNPELIFTDAQSANETQINGEIYQSDKEFFLKIPIVSNSKTLEILKDSQKLSEINLQDMGARPCKK